MLIYVNGDSFTAGVHLFDEIFPSYPGDFTCEELISRQSEIKKFEKFKSIFLQRYVDYEKLLDLDVSLEFFDTRLPNMVKLANNINEAEKQKAYPAYIKSIDRSIEIINNAVPGASISGICYRSILDLLSLKGKGITVDCVIIQLTSLSRYEIFDHKHNRLLYDRPIGTFKDDLDNAIGNAVAKKYTDEDFLIKYLHHLTLIVETVRSVIGKNPILIDSNNEWILKIIDKTKDSLAKQRNPLQLERLDILLKHSLIETVKFNFMQDIALSIQEKGFVYDGHYSFNTHKEVAKKVLELL